MDTNTAKMTGTAKGLGLKDGETVTISTWDGELIPVTVRKGDRVWEFVTADGEVQTTLRGAEKMTVRR